MIHLFNAVHQIVIISYRKEITLEVLFLLMYSQQRKLISQFPFP